MNRRETNILGVFNALGKDKNQSEPIKYNTKDPNPDYPADRIFMPKFRKKGRVRQPLSDDIKLDFGILDPDAMKRVETSDFWGYCETFLNRKRYFGLGKQASSDKILTFSKSISTPVTNLIKDLRSLSLKNYKRIYYVINQRISEQAEINLIKRMIKMAIKSSAEFRDELYFQLIKQMRSNPSQEATYHCWSLMAVMSVFITPSKQSSFYIMNYIKEVATSHPDDQIREWAMLIFKRLLVGYYTEGRKVLPCSSEIKSIKEKKKLVVQIKLFTGGYLDVYFECYETVKQIIEQICEKMGIKKDLWNRFGIYEVSTKVFTREEAFIEEPNKLADVIASWEHEEDFYKEKTKKPLQVNFELFFKVRFVYSLDRNSYLDFLILYNEACFLYKLAHTSLDYDELINATVIHLQILFGDYTLEKFSFMRKRLYYQLPKFKSKFEQNKATIMSDILNKYRELKGISRHEGRSLFLDIFSKKDSFLHNLYICKKKTCEYTELKFPDDMIIGLGSEHMRVMDEDYNQVHDISYELFWKWGFSDSEFSFLVGRNLTEQEDKDDKPQKFSVSTLVGICMSYTLFSYTELILGKSPQGNTLTFSATDKMKIGATEFFKRVNIFPLNTNPHESDEEEIDDDNN